jgi:hypothetical protein
MILDQSRSHPHLTARTPAVRARPGRQAATVAVMSKPAFAGMTLAIRGARAQISPWVRKSVCHSLEPFEKAQNGNGRLLQKVGMDAQSAPHLFGARASSFGGCDLIFPGPGRHAPGTAGGSRRVAWDWRRKPLKRLNCGSEISETSSSQDLGHGAGPHLLGPPFPSAGNGAGNP